MSCGRWVGDTTGAATAVDMQTVRQATTMILTDMAETPGGVVGINREKCE